MAGRDDFIGLRGAVLILDLRRDSFSVDVDATLTTSTLADLDDDDFSAPMMTFCDENLVFLFDFSSADVRCCRLPLLFPLVLAVCFVPRTTFSCSSQ